MWSTQVSSPGARDVVDGCGDIIRTSSEYLRASGPFLHLLAPLQKDKQLSMLILVCTPPREKLQVSLIETVLGIWLLC